MTNEKAQKIAASIGNAISNSVCPGYLHYFGNVRGDSNCIVLGEQHATRFEQCEACWESWVHKSPLILSGTYKVK